MDTAEPTIELTDATDVGAYALVGEMEREIDALYADRVAVESSMGGVTATPAEMSPPDGGFLLVRLGDEPVGCGGFKRIGADACEIKRMYLRPDVRGRGLAGALLSAIEAAARDVGFRIARLDTGDRQPSAKRLYERAGYREIENFNGNTVARHWFEKEL